jgi:hypothetical protein
MGLDMYLHRKHYCGGGTIKGRYEPGDGGASQEVCFSNVSAVEERVMYWRKANAIHNWFLQNVVEEDASEPSYVSGHTLHQLKESCEKEIATKGKAGELTPMQGFFFGSQEKDDDYFQDLEDTVKALGDLDPDGEYYYRASW